jgi:hypothetical protein
MTMPVPTEIWVKVLLVGVVDVTINVGLLRWVVTQSPS